MAPTKQTPGKFTRLTQRLQRYPSEGRLILGRNLALGAAAACLVILVQILQVGAKDEALTLSVVAIAVGIPLWFLIAVLYEYYIYLGARSYPHLRGRFAPHLVGVVGGVAGLALFAAVGGVIWHLVPDALFAFLGASAAALVLYYVFHATLARWWFTNGGPGANESSESDT